MQTRKQLRFVSHVVGMFAACCLSIVYGTSRGAAEPNMGGAGSGSSEVHRGPDHTRPASGVTASSLTGSATNCRQHENWQTPNRNVSGNISDCPLTQCGVNGVWLGSGVQFRTLHLTAGVPNPQGVRIKEFRSSAGALLKIEVHGQELQGITTNPTNSTILKGPDLQNAKLYLEQITPNNIIPYTLTITSTAAPFDPKVDYSKFWIEYTDKAAPPHDPEPSSVNLYTFTVTSGDGCPVQLCKPGLNDDYSNGLYGTAVIFRGDLYNETKYEVSDQFPDSLDDDVFNISCLGTAISKLHLLRHTNASARNPGAPSTPQRTTMLKLLTADYCGTGNPFTIEGVPIALGVSAQTISVTPQSHYSMNDAGLIDAAWTEKGASCIGTSRLSEIKIPERPYGITGSTADVIRNQINSKCQQWSSALQLPPPKTIPSCVNLPNNSVTSTAPFSMNNYGASQISSQTP